VALDPEIRNWVMLPVLVGAASVNFMRMYAMKLLAPSPDGSVPLDKSDLQQRGIVAISQRLRMNGGYISQKGMAMRKEYLIGKDTGKLLKKDFKEVNPMAAMSGPGAMDGMKMNVSGPLPLPLDTVFFSTSPLTHSFARVTPTTHPSEKMVLMFFNFGVMFIVNFFFSGFVVLRLPFSLTEKFKALTQQGVGIPSLDSSFVSTMSWWMICQIGLTASFRLLSKGGPSAEEQMQMQIQMGPMMGQQPQGFQAKAAFAGEEEALKILEWAPTPLLLGERSLLDQALSKGLCPIHSASSNPSKLIAKHSSSSSSSPVGDGGNPALGKKTN